MSHHAPESPLPIAVIVAVAALAIATAFVCLAHSYQRATEDSLEPAPTRPRSTRFEPWEGK